MNISRREFLKKTSIITLGFSSIGRLVGSVSTLIDDSSYPKLIEDPKKILNLPKNFSYKIISKYKNKMHDGLRVPNNADGMGCV